MTERVPLLLDVDTGIDDAAAIALAWHSPETRLLSVSTVAGNTTIGNATRNTLDVLDLLGASSVEVYQGASRPLVRELVTASYAHGDNGVGGAALQARTVAHAVGIGVRMDGLEVGGTVVHLGAFRV